MLMIHLAAFLICFFEMLAHLAPSCNFLVSVGGMCSCLSLNASCLMRLVSVLNVSCFGRVNQKLHHLDLQGLPFFDNISLSDFAPRKTVSIPCQFRVNSVPRELAMASCGVSPTLDFYAP